MNYKMQKIINKLTFGLSEMGPGFTMGDIWYNFKNGLWNLKKFFKVVWEWRSWDNAYNLNLYAKSLELYLEQSPYSPALEIDKTRIPKERNMKRVVELIKNRNDDNYIERVEEEMGRDVNYGFSFKEIKGDNGEKMYEMLDHATEEEKEFRTKVYKRVDELTRDEWNELWDIIRDDSQGWWT